MKLKKMLASFVALAMALSTMSFTAFAEEPEATGNVAARIGDVTYEDVASAFSEATDGDEVEILLAGTYAPAFSGKDITVTGKTEGVVFDNIGAYNMGGADVTFNNVTFDYYPNGNYAGLQHAGALVYNDCAIDGQVFLYGTSETFIGCTFNQNSSDAYNVWTYGAKTVEFTDCTFNSAGKSVLVYNEGACATDLSVSETTFNASASVEGKAAIEIDTSLMPSGTTIEVDDKTTAEGFSTGSVSGNTLWNDKKADSTETGGTSSVVIVAGEIVKNAAPVEVTTYEELAVLLTNGDREAVHVVMANDITGTAALSSGYGVAGVVVQAGDVLDGNGHTLTINGANTTWDCAVAMRGGTVKNLTISGAMRGVFMPGANGDVVIDNCVFDNVIYTFNSDAGNKDYSVTIKNTTLNGWTSFSNAHKSVTFENCTFGEGNDYAYCRPYNDTTFTGCEFNEGFEIDAKKTSTPLEFSNCTYDGVSLTAENGNVLFPKGGTVVIDNEEVVFEEIALPTATVTSIENENLTFALNFKADEASAEQLAYYGDWYADFVLTINKDVTFNANGGADGYLSGQYDLWSENWVNVPFDDVTIKAGEPLKIMEYAATLMGQSGLKLTYNDVYSYVKDFDCGVFFEEEFLAENPDLEVKLELRMYNNEDESESYSIGETYTFEVEDKPEDLRIFSLASAYVDYLPISLYPDNIKLYRLGLYSAAEGTDYDEYGFEVTVDGQEPVMIKAEKYDGEIMLRVGMDRIDTLKPSNFDYNGSSNVCIFGQTIAFDESAVGEGKVKYRPYVVIDGKTYWGYTFTAPNIYTK